ncbi:MAG: 3-deoxy-8-phosphooctulonate synthase [candidate division Zixibacteria bacterium]|nr:3-deoxy-8-phosphooctulonate synthase [candidate division Zixibacteria bacterium]
MADKKIQIGPVEIGGGKPFIIAGPCVVESRDIAFAAADEITKVSQKFKIPVVYKSSFIKANRQAGASFASIGIDNALKILGEVKAKYNLPILTDIHNTDQVSAAAEVADCLQIPAFLCRQTELIKAAAKTGLPLNIKKGQFMAPEDMNDAAIKATEEGNSKVILTERGSTFGYHDLVVDFRSIVIMKNLGYPVVFDCTHSVQKPGSAGNSSGGAPEFIIPLAKAAAAVGVDGLFIETHPEPKDALCDQNCQLKLDLLEAMVGEVMGIWE